MREIKFRAWHDGIKKMINVYVLSQQTDASGRYETDCRGWYGENSQVTFSLHEVVLEQYSGLKDKNGKMIWEGDIVKDQKKEPNIGQVFWHQASFRIEWQMRSYDGTRPVEVCTDDCFGYAEVIGNIHENSDLL